MFGPDLFQVCMNRLGKFEETDYKSAVALYAGYLLTAAQRQLDTVNHVSQPDKQYENMIPVKHETLEQGITVRVFQPVVVEYEEEGVEEDAEGGGDGDEEYEDDEDSLDSEERYEEVTTKKTQMGSISTEPSKIEKQDIFIDTRIKPLMTTDKATTLTTTTTIKQMSQSSETAVVFEVTEHVNIIHNKGLSTEKPLNPNNISFIEGKDNTGHHENEISSTKDLIIKHNNSESESKVDGKINLEQNLHENKMSKTDNTSVKTNNTETKTTASPNFILTSSPSFTNQTKSSLTVNETKDTTISKLILTSTPSYAKETNKSLSVNETEDTKISNISNNEAEKDNKTTTTVSPLHSLNNSSNSTAHESGYTVTLVTNETNDSISRSTNSPQMSNEIEKDRKKNKTGNTIYTENETIDDKSVLNISVPAEAPVHLPKDIESNVIDGEEHTGDDEGDSEDLEVAGSSIIARDPDSSMSNTRRRKRSNENSRYSNEVIMISKLDFEYLRLLKLSNCSLYELVRRILLKHKF